jgi:hypothetical protein
LLDEPAKVALGLQMTALEQGKCVSISVAALPSATPLRWLSYYPDEIYQAGMNIHE